MRLSTVIVLTFIYSGASGQVLTAKYRDYHGHRLQLNSDSTFRFDWRFDLIHSWATGKWSTSGRTINFQFKNVVDTLSRANKPDSLVLSLDEKSNRINDQEFLSTLLVSGGQQSEQFPNKLFKKGKRLFIIDKEGRLDRKRHRGIWPQKRWPFGYKKWPTLYKVES
jgi:hypothetical protein